MARVRVYADMPNSLAQVVLPKSLVAKFLKPLFTKHDILVHDAMYRTYFGTESTDFHLTSSQCRHIIIMPHYPQLDHATLLESSFPQPDEIHRRHVLKAVVSPQFPALYGHGQWYFRACFAAETTHAICVVGESALESTGKCSSQLTRLHCLPSG